MTVALLFLSAIMAVVVWWLVRPTLNASPWIERSTIHTARDNQFSMAPVQVGLWVFLAVATSLFFYAFVLQSHSLGAAGAVAAVAVAWSAVERPRAHKSGTWGGHWENSRPRQVERMINDPDAADK